ncbi:uncharacterized protein SPAPADRAFT_154832 [Spathaspora passalidarum NRRL Y-27907]|uniref:DUF3533 domain-containing protein n=1 Tax=Spathaspora passalidarum (strain NRRL Y-27907 / 11-Y1) TaxID=619300 RepID=G3AQI7_SPAPN|nr:uncharacterized protein SPAPADRAFT_154832 [Spathaspora passalidarum NRRL Y-27907]EGW31534.1 hypothetical protein SPAPADRAFT_154832 [Spathaspora passalidarum NRRL Y-27907]
MSEDNSELARIYSTLSIQPSVVESMQPYIGRSSQDTEKGNSGSDDIDDENEKTETSGAPLSRQQTFLQKVQSRYSFFNENLNEHRKKLYLKFGMIYLTMAVGVLAIFSIYWGSMYGRNGRIQNLNMLVIIEDDTTINGIPPLFGDFLKQVLDTPLARARGNWHIFNSTEFGQIAVENNNNIEQELERQIHHQKYWSSIYVKPNATWNFYNAIITGDTGYNVTNSSIVSVYETGRDFMNMNLYITPSIQAVERLWLGSQANLTDTLVQHVNGSALSQAGAINILATPLNFVYYDRIKYTDPVLVAPSQVGLIYMVIITFFQFNFFSDLHMAIAKTGMHKHHYVLYRIFASVLSYFVLSLFFSLVSLAFQVDFTKAFGKAGFLVYWLLSFLTMWAVGAANELMALLCILVYPPLIGFWMLFWVIINIAPTFTPIALSPEFFRYGYSMPIHNSYEAAKVVLFNTYKGQMGRNVGILIAWVVLLTAATPFVIAFFGKTMMKRAQKAAKEEAEKKKKKEEEEEEAESGGV